MQVKLHYIPRNVTGFVVNVLYHVINVNRKNVLAYIVLVYILHKIKQLTPINISVAFVANKDTVI